MQRVGPRRQVPGTFHRLENGLECWETYCDRCGTYQTVIDHVMERHDTQGRVYDAKRTVATRGTTRILDRTSRWVQPELQLDLPDDDEEIPF